jgi:DNA-directed RNA polymerase sigma subunit (sigma70/sigma32)
LSPFIASARRNNREPSAKSSISHSCRSSASSVLSMTATSNNKSSRTTPIQKSTETHHDNYIFQDTHGSINRELAEQFYVWEQNKRKCNQLEPLDFSMRAAVRLVHEAAMRQLSRRNDNPLTMEQQQQQQQSSLYSELVQDGLSALLEAMSTYDATRESCSWEDYAQACIQKAMAKSLEQAEHLIQIPHAVQRVVQKAREIYRTLSQQQTELQHSQDSAMPRVVTVDMVAKRLHMATSELEDYLKWYNRYVRTRSSSVIPLESTVEISHPMLDDANPQFVNIDDWERRQGYHRPLLGDYRKSRNIDERKYGTNSLGDEEDDATDILEYLDEYQETEGDDDAWIQEHEQVAGMLQDIIPDKEEQYKELLEPSLEDDVLADLIRENLGSFLQTNLSSNELAIVQMAFGLEGRQPASFRQMASELKLQDKSQAVRLLERALTKLRTAFQQRYFEPHDDDSDDTLETESV